MSSSEVTSVSHDKVLGSVEDIWIHRYDLDPITNHQSPKLEGQRIKFITLSIERAKKGPKKPRKQGKKS